MSSRLSLRLLDPLIGLEGSSVSTKRIYLDNNNEQLVDEAARAIQDRYAAIAHRQELEDTITQTYNELWDLLIQMEVASKEKLHKLAATVKESKAEVERVKFEMQIQVPDLQMKLQPTTPPEVWEQHEVAIKADMEVLEVGVKDCSQIFDNTMEMWASLQEDPHVQNIEAGIRDKQL